MRAIAFGLTDESVLGCYQVARMLDAKALQSECERLVLQNAPALEHAGVFSQAGVSAHSTLCALVANVLRRHAAAVVCEHDRGHGLQECPPPAWAEETDVFASACAHSAWSAGVYLQTDDVDESSDDEDEKWGGHTFGERLVQRCARHPSISY